MNQTQVNTKSSGDQLSALEFNQVNDTINSNALEASGFMPQADQRVVDELAKLRILEDNSLNIINQQTTEGLLMSYANQTNGSVAYDLWSQAPMFSNNGSWHRLSDNKSIDSFEEIDLYIVMGQSNADGKAFFTNLDAATQSKDRSGFSIYLSTIDHVERTPIVTPWTELQGGNTAMSADRFGPELGFVDAVKDVLTAGGDAKYSKPIAILKHAKGNTSLATHWSTTGDVYIPMTETIPTSMFELGQLDKRFKPKGLVWYQGENDAQNEADALVYKNNLIAFFDDVKNRFYEDIPIVICQIHDQIPAAYVTEVRQAQSEIALEYGYALIDTSVYSRRDDWHLDASGMYALGQAIEQAFRQF